MTRLNNKFSVVIVVLVAAAGVTLAGCGGSPDAPIRASQVDSGPSNGGSNSNPGPQSAPASGLNPYVTNVLSQTNQQRALNGVAALSWNDKLGHAAQDYAEWMARDGFFSHTGPDGSTAGSRITAAGYSWSTYGENIANGYATPDAVMTGWMNSPGHRSNILSAAYAEIGIGYAVSSGGTAYWVQDFGRSN